VSCTDGNSSASHAVGEQPARSRQSRVKCAGDLEAPVLVSVVGDERGAGVQPADHRAERRRRLPRVRHRGQVDRALDGDQGPQPGARTTRNFPRLRNDTLCHGRSGNAELLLRFSELRDETAFRLEANVQVQSQWRNFDDIQSGVAEESGNFFPGLMLGISGFGMHYLRLAYPDRVPSVLLLDPPLDP